MESLKKSSQLVIICPVLDCWKYTIQFVNSLKDIDFVKLIIINNGSSPEETAKLNTLKNNPRIDILDNKKNIGVAPAWNQGVYYAITEYNPEYFLICNNDILLRKDTIKNLIKAIKMPDVVLATPTNTKNWNEDPEGLYTYLVPKIPRLYDEPDFSCFMIKKETLSIIGNFDERFWPAYFEDNDYHYRIKLAGKRGVKSNKSLYYHFGSMTIKEGEVIAKISNENYLINKQRFVDKWGGEPGHEIFTKPR